MYNFSIFETSIGKMGLVASKAGLHRIVLPKKNTDIPKILRSHYIELERDEDFFKYVKKRLADYLSGSEDSFLDVKLDLKGVTPFELRVYDVAMSIPRGEVRSYSYIAKILGGPKKTRAVGKALANNRIPIVIPCHRVIEKDGNLGGFNAGVDLKRFLLKLEGYFLC
jgi:methylated-DNA-[protein]-cysteine S-methyltransferase